MRKSYENNRNLLGKHKSLKELYTENRLYGIEPQELEMRRTKPKVLKKIRKKLRIQKQRRRLKSIIALLIALGIVSLAFTALEMV